MTDHTELKPRCPICTNLQVTVPNDEEYIRCNRCGVVKTKYSYDSKLYREDYADNYVEYAKTIVNIPLNLFRVGLVSRWLSPEETILDIGCCIGEFVRFAEPYYRCTGFEPNPMAAAMAKERVKSEIITKLHKGLHVNCITMFDVFEHIEDPISFLDYLYGILEPGGILALTTPNAGCIPNWSDDQLRGWKHYKPKEHLFLYSEEALDYITHRAGFKLLHVGTEESDIRPGNPNGDILTYVTRKE